MKSYTVRMEFISKEVIFAEHTVQASSPNGARLRAIDEYRASKDELNLDYWNSDKIDTTLDTSCSKDWEVIEEGE